MHLASNIDMKNGSIGGAIIGLSAVGFMALAGKITGLSSITEGIIVIPKAEDWNYSYTAGLVASALLLKEARPESFPSSDSNLSTVSLLCAGLLTGFGTRMGNGCTSGHGLCGLGRRSPRSLVAVLSFMASGALTAYITQRPDVAPYLTATSADEDSFHVLLVPLVFISSFSLYVALNWESIKKSISSLFQAITGKTKTTGLTSTQKFNPIKIHLAAFGSAFAFGIGLGFSGMTNPDRIINFLNFSGDQGWDPSLISVLGVGVAMTFTGFHLLKNKEAPLLLDSCKNCSECIKLGNEPPNRNIDWKLIAGSALFGIGWAWGGFCPGPAIISFVAGVKPLKKFLPSMLAGILLKDTVMG